ncbi:hypothetical protein PoB_005531200 [Plakobranchus ocellatus]|uniref:Fibrinogen C-terminal domain-containing protein n=1 Tax=Plakobranchus ocellatus TaxID=259542 RepID=A0AAV4CBT9_9GAST|nr:hypothetical protein PoB_005531200 [Plakobranchus ocellatus]
MAPTETTMSPTETTMSPTETTMALRETTMSPTETTTTPTETTMSPTETTMAPRETTMARIEITAAPREIITVQWTRTPISNGDCQNGGIPVDFFSCDCSTTGGWVGYHCESRPESCKDLLFYEYPDGDYFVTLYPNGGNSFDAYCSVQGFQALINLVRSSGNYNTSYPLSTYQSGFHLGFKDFWIGLDTMTALTQFSPNSLTFTVHYSSSEFQGKAWVEYFGVTFSSTSSDVYTARQDFAFSTSGHDIQPFGTSTAGLIPDPEVIDCAKSPNFAAPGLGGASNCGNVGNRGWWYTTCGTTNPMGWNYKILPGATTSEHVLIPGVDMTQARVREAFDYFTVTVDDI